MRVSNSRKQSGLNKSLAKNDGGANGLSSTRAAPTLQQEVRLKEVQCSLEL